MVDLHRLGEVWIVRDYSVSILALSQVDCVSFGDVEAPENFLGDDDADRAAEGAKF